MSDLMMLNKVGHRIDPCGTQAFMSSKVERLSLILTENRLFERNEVIVLRKKFSM